MLQDIIDALRLLMQIDMALTLLPFLLVLLSVGLHVLWIICIGSVGVIYASCAKIPLGARKDVVLQELRLNQVSTRISQA